PEELHAHQDAVKAAETAVDGRKQSVRRAWQTMEKENSVVAGRVIRPDLNLDFLQQDEHGQPIADDGKRLLSIDQLKFEPLPDLAGRKPPLVVIAVSGGGLRSAA